MKNALVLAFAFQLLSALPAQAGAISQGGVLEFPFPEKPSCETCVEFYRTTDLIHTWIGAKAQFRGEGCEGASYAAFGLPQEDDAEQTEHILAGEYGSFRYIGRSCGANAAKAWAEAQAGSEESWKWVFKSQLYIMTARAIVTPVMGRACKNGAETVETRLRKTQSLDEVVPRTRLENVTRWLW